MSRRVTRRCFAVGVALGATLIVACHRYGPPAPTTIVYADAPTSSSTTTWTPIASSSASSSTSAISAASSSPSTSDTSLEADATIAKNRWRFKKCYTHALAKNPNAGGAIRVKVTVDPSGAVTSATLASTTADAELSQCIVEAFPPMLFPHPVPEGRSITYTVPVVLSAKK